MDFPQVTGTIIFTDNQSYITFTQNSVNHSHTKHIDIQYHFICKHVEMGEIDL